MYPDKNSYDDIINLPYRKSSFRKSMSMDNRAAQFAPFAAVVGHDKAIEETARLTQSKVELDDYEKTEINHRIMYAVKHTDTPVRVVYFVPDTEKDGGSYATAEGLLTELREFERELVIDDSIVISIDQILDFQ